MHKHRSSVVPTTAMAPQNSSIPSTLKVWGHRFNFAVTQATRHGQRKQSDGAWWWSRCFPAWSLTWLLYSLQSRTDHLILSMHLWLRMWKASRRFRYSFKRIQTSDPYHAIGRTPIEYINSFIDRLVYFFAYTKFKSFLDAEAMPFLLNMFGVQRPSDGCIKRPSSAVAFGRDTWRQ